MKQNKPYNIQEIKISILRETPAISEVCDVPEKAVSKIRELAAGNPYFDTEKENFIILHLNTRRKIISWELYSQGTKDTLLVHPGEVFRSAIVSNASAIILAHNHPSGDATPSEADVKVTRDLIRAGQLLKVDVIDHIVFTNNDYKSLRELGYFYT